ncbi:hypothetical protein [Janthinobacterium sp.]|uniref:hypothetical protein n=1 Tax=Janthinobacterium sp. TaxID=1871054 RepID=UPI002630781A|nr:hypothetical protein [Janthinobacterium sp.]
MKNLYLRSMLAAACAVTLAACGGSGGNLYLTGGVSGLAKDGLILQNGSESLPVSSGATSFTFTQLLNTDDSYNITIKQQPTGAVCTVINGSGKASAYSVGLASISCLTNQYTLGGTITGLTADGLVLNIGSNTSSPLAGSTTFVFGGTVGDGAPYNVNVLQNPPGLTCSVSNPNGTMGSGNNTSLVASCVPK